VSKTSQLQEVTSIIELVLGRADELVSPCSAYLLGSYADDTYIPTSDIDLCIITRTSYEASLLRLHFNEPAWFTKYPLDLTFIDLERFLDPQLFQSDNLLWRESVLNVILESKLVFGQDIRNKLELPTPELYRDYTAPLPLEFIARIRGCLSTDIKHPVSYPNEADYYYGYVDSKNKLKLIVSIVGWIATSVLSFKKAPMIGKKSSVVNQYKLSVNDEWTGYIEDVFGLCRDKLHYEIPILENDKEALRILCRKLLSLENYYINIYGEDFLD